MTLTSWIQMDWSWVHFHINEHNGNKKCTFSAFLFKSLWDQISLWCKRRQGQPRIIIYINIIYFWTTNSNIPSSWQMAQWFWRRTLFTGFPYMSMAAILFMWPGPNQISLTLCQKGNWNWPSSFRGAVLWRWWQTSDEQPFKWPCPLEVIGFDFKCISISESTIAAGRESAFFSFSHSKA